MRGGEVELVEKLGRKDPCPCGSGLSFQALLPAIRPVSTGRSGLIIGGSEARAGSARVIAAQGRTYAEKLSLDELKAITSFNRTPAATRFKAAQPEVIAGTAKAMEGVDFKGETMAAFCKKTGKGCGESEVRN